MSFLHEILQRDFQFFKLMADIVDKPQTHHFDFPGVFPAYFHSQKLWVHIHCPFWNFFKSWVAFSLEKFEFYEDFFSLINTKKNGIFRGILGFCSSSNKKVSYRGCLIVGKSSFPKNAAIHRISARELFFLGEAKPKSTNRPP